MISPEERQVPAEPGIQLCAFFVGAEEYALDIMRVVEILQPLPATPVPGLPGFIEGVLNLRGQILPVVDVRKRLGAGPKVGTLKPKLLVCLIGRRKVALSVDGVSEVFRVEKGQLKPAAMAAPSAQAFVLGVCGEPRRLRLLLDLKALLEVNG